MRMVSLQVALHAQTRLWGLQGLRDEKDAVEATIAELAEDIAADLGLILDKTIKLEWHKVANTRTRCLRITQVGDRTAGQAVASHFEDHSSCRSWPCTAGCCSSQELHAV